MRWLSAVSSALLLMACASGPAVHQAQPTALMLALARADSRTIHLSAYAGRPLLLFLFATYDESSQLALAKLTRFLAKQPAVQVAGVLLQPDAATFLPLFKEAVAPPFEVYYDQEQRILQGDSALGALEAIPAFVALDEAGRISAIRYGVQTDEQLQTLTRP